MLDTPSSSFSEYCYNLIGPLRLCSCIEVFNLREYSKSVLIHMQLSADKRSIGPN